MSSTRQIQKSLPTNRVATEEEFQRQFEVVSEKTTVEYHSERRDDIKKIEGDSEALAEMMLDMHALVIDQEDMIDQVGKGVEKTKEKVDEGKKKLVEAEQKQNECCPWWLTPWKYCCR